MRSCSPTLAVTSRITWFRTTPGAALSDRGPSQKADVKSASCSRQKGIRNLVARSCNLPAHISNTLAYYADHHFALLIAIFQSPASHAKRAEIPCELYNVL